MAISGDKHRPCSIESPTETQPPLPTILSHAAVPLALGVGLGSRTISRPLLAAGIVGAIAPDLDVIGFHFHVAYAHQLGHRGASHSATFALALALLALACAPWLRSGRMAAFCFVGLCTLSHGLLDMCTNGGLGIALWWPWSGVRLFTPWRVIEVSPLSLGRVFSARGWVVIRSELWWVWLPATLTAASLLGVRKLWPGPALPVQAPGRAIDANRGHGR